MNYRKTEINLEKRIARRLRDRGWTIKQIAKLFGVPTEIIDYWGWRYRVVFYPNHIFANRAA